MGIAAGLTFGAPASAPAQESPQVLMVDNEPDLTRWHYEPADITVPAGTTVVWLNKGKEDHTVTADDKSFDSGLKKTGGTFSRAFGQPGNYSYYCQPHPWMKGTVQVVASASPATAASAPTSTTAAPAPSTATAPPPAPAAPEAPADASAPAQGGEDGADGTAAGPQGPSSETDGRSDEGAAASGADGDGSGGSLAGTLAVVLLPTLGALALGAKLRQAKT